MKRLFGMILVLAMLMGFILPSISLEAKAAPIEYYENTTDFSGLQLSVIGDSISTYEGVTNSKTYNPLYLSTSEATYGTYYGNTSFSSYSQFAAVTRGETWWQQTVDTLGMNLLVNNSWSGSFVLRDNANGNTTEYPAAGYKERSVNLHMNGKNPDIIAVFLGTNDIGNYSTTNIGSKADIDTASERKALYTSINSYATPTSSVQAYYIMISRMLAKYPDVEIYCMLPTVAMSTNADRTTAHNNFNNAIRYMVDVMNSDGKKVFLVDLDRNSGLVDNEMVKDYYYANYVHPDCAGMDWITTCLISEIMEHSTKGNGQSRFHSVSYNLSDVIAKDGLPRQATEGQPLEVNFIPYTTGQHIDVTVTMKDANGNNVTIPNGGVRGHSVYIPEVTGPITVTAKVGNKENFYWNASSEAFAAATAPGFAFNTLALVSGTYTGGTNSGSFTDAYYSLARPVTLKYDQPWVFEFKGSGTLGSGILLTSKTSAATTNGNLYFHLNQNNVLIGYRQNDNYYNSGIPWTTVASKVGSSSGANFRTETHTYRFVNVPNGTNNKIYLYVDGVNVGTMDATKLVGGSATHTDAASINISGKDFEINFLGSETYPLRNYSLSYIKAWENGIAEPKTENYRWELNSDRDEFVTREDNFFVANEIRQQAGTISNGTFTNTYFEIDKQVMLMHDEEWNLEWVSSGSWLDAMYGAMLLCTSNGSNDLNMYYLYRRHESDFIALGERKNGAHHNYGVSLKDNGIDGTARHKYNLVNEVTYNSSGAYVSNMIYLYVDDVKIAPMTTYYKGGTATGTTSEWVKGKDFTFNYMGNQTFSVGNCNLEYLQVTVTCEHNYIAVVTKPTCTMDGYTTYTCSACGESYTDDVVAATGHSWTNASCTTAKTCIVCGEISGEALGHSYSAFVTAPTCTADGFTTYICTGCGTSYTGDYVLANGHIYSSVTTNTTCTIDGYTTYTCSGCGISYVSDIVTATGHSYSGGKCTGCGIADPNYSPDYYLFGYINGADYGCEGDWETLGQYKFVNGQLTATFTQDSYIAVKDSSNLNWFMFNSYVTASSGTLYNTTLGSNEKMFVPGGVEITFTLTVNSDNSLNLSYTIAEPEVVVPTLTLNYPSLSFEDEILYNVYYTLDDASSIVEMGLLTFATRDANGTVDTANQIIPGYVNSGSTYMVQSKGIPAKNLSDAVYFKVYAKLTDGSYVYTDVAGYNAVAYANTVLGKANSSAKAKALVVAMLNYGAAAQEYFGYKTESLMNAGLTAEQQALVEDYNDTMVQDVVKADASKVGSFVMNGGYSNIFPTVSFEGAFSINFYFTPNKTVGIAPTMYYWDAKTYASVDVLTPENATGVLTMNRNGSNWGAAVEGIAAKSIDETVYVAGFYTSGGVDYPTGIVAYSLGNYCKTLAAGGTEFGAATAVYGFYAKAYFS